MQDSQQPSNETLIKTQKSRMNPLENPQVKEEKKKKVKE